MWVMDLHPTDRALVTELLARYAEAIDAGDFDAVGRLFAQGAITDADGREIARGADAVAALYAATTRRHADGTPATAHLVSNVIVDPIGPDEVEVRSRFLVVQGTPTLPLQPVVVGRYVDLMHRDADGSWRFGRRRMVPERWGDVSQHLTFTPTSTPE